MDERERRIGQNEALFREVNERVGRVNDVFERTPDLLTLICECGSEGCLDHIELTRAEYESLRADPVQFAIKPGHEHAEVETVVEQNDRYWVVRKHRGEPARLAERTHHRG